MASSLESGLLIAATVANGLLAGGSLIKSVVELPARHRIGLQAMAAYHRAADLGSGLILYPLMGIGAPALTFAAALALYAAPVIPPAAPPWAYAAAALSAAHIYTTIRAAPNLLRLRSGTMEERLLEGIYHRFIRWHGARAVLQVLAFIATVGALSSTS